MILRTNRFAKYKFDTNDTFEAGASLKGYQVKAIRRGEFNVQESFIKLVNNELYLFNFMTSTTPSDVQRNSPNIKLLLNRKEINKIKILLDNRRVQGYLLSVKINNKSLIKFEIGFGMVKKSFQQRKVEKRSTQKRRLEKEMDL